MAVGEIGRSLRKGNLKC